MLNIGETETESHFRVRISTERLLDRLIAHHDYSVPCLKLPATIPEPEPKPLPPISNRSMVIACQIAFPPAIFNHIEAVQRAVLLEFPKVSMIDMKSPRRTKLIVYVRQLAMYVAKTVTARSLPEIGRRFGGRDHTTVLYSVRKFEQMVGADPVLAALVERIKGNIPELGI